MQASFRQLAQHAQLSAANAALLPPIPLYRQLLRSHRLLPVEMRSLGDGYLKSEFKRHRTADNPVHVMGFLLEWNKYLHHLHEQLGDGHSADTFRGKKMEEAMFDQMSNEQLGQLYELMHASKDVWRPVDPVSRPGEEAENPPKR